MSMFDNDKKSKLTLNDFDLHEKLKIYNSDNSLEDLLDIIPSLFIVNEIASITLEIDSAKFKDELVITEDENVKSKKHGVLENWFILTAREFVQRYYTSMEDYIEYELCNVIDKRSDKLVGYSGHELVERENLDAILYNRLSAQDNTLLPKVVQYRT